MSEREKKKLQEKHEKILLDMMKSNEKNQYCADCKTKGPRWASTNLGVFLCMPCAGLHRKMGTHISKVKSITLDSWTEEQIEHFQKWGNEKANALYNPHPEQHPHPVGDSEMEQYIRDKYERKVFMEGSKKNAPLKDSSTRTDAPPERSQQYELSPALATLREMGWADEQRNREVLARCRGDVNAAIEVLCSLPPGAAEQQRKQQAGGQQSFALAPPSRQQAAGPQSSSSSRLGPHQQGQQTGGDLDLLGDVFAAKEPFGADQAQQQQKGATKDSIMSLFNTAQPVPAMGFGGPAFGGPSFGTNIQMQHPGFSGQHPNFPGQQQPGFPGQQQPGFPGQQQSGFPGQHQQVVPGHHQQAFHGQQHQAFPQQGLQQSGIPQQQMRNQMMGGSFGQSPQFQDPGFSQQTNPFQQPAQQPGQFGGFGQQQQQAGFQGTYQTAPGGAPANPFMAFGGGNQQFSQNPSQIPRQLDLQQFGGLQPPQMQGQQPQQRQANNQAFASLNPFGATGAVQTGESSKKAGAGNPFA